jgi:hypothetical protein
MNPEFRGYLVSRSGMNRVDEDGTLDGINYALMTWKEKETIMECSKLRKKKPSLEEFMSCLKAKAIYEKTEWLTNHLCEDEKDIIKIYNAVVCHHEVSPLLDPKTLKSAIISHEDVQMAVNNYFDLMDDYDQLVFEDPFYFLKKEPFSIHAKDMNQMSDRELILYLKLIKSNFPT